MKMYFGVFKKKYFCVVAIVLAFVLIASCCAILTNISYGDVFAFDSSNLSATKDLGVITLDGYEDRTDGKIFKDTGMTAIYEALTGKKGATLSDVEKLNTLSSAEISSKNGNKDLILTIDGKKWTATYLTKDTGGDVILTLWLASSAETHQWNKWIETSSNGDYPGNMYSSSFIRADALNSGTGYIANKTDAALTDYTQSSTHEYAKFTMPSVKGSLTSCIATPAKLAYQGIENNVEQGDRKYTIVNEAYDTPYGKINYYTNGTVVNHADYPVKQGYTDWKNDYIWLPSLTETGYYSSVSGIWALSDNQRSNSENTWLRSSHRSDVACAYYLDSSSKNTSCLDNHVTNFYAVRPAFHFNLIAADKSTVKPLSKPTDFEITYDGSEKDISLATWYDKDIHGNNDKITVTYSESTHIDAKEYTVTLTIIDDTYSWIDASSPADKTRTCKMTIEKAEPTVNPIIGTGKLYPGSDMPGITTSAGDTPGSIAWDDSKIIDGKTSYGWTFTSSDSNYKDKQSSSTLTISSIEVSAIEADFTPPAGTVIYTSTNLDSLKSYLTVTKKNNNGSSAGTAGQDEYTLSGSLNAGKSTITVTLKKGGQATNITTTFDVDVTAVSLTSMTASLNSGSSVYTTTKLDDIKAMLTVTGTNNDKSTINVTSDKYSLSCSTVNADKTLPTGSQTLKLTLNSDSNITCNVTVQVVEPAILKIEAIKLGTFPTTVYDITPLNTLKKYLKVVVTYADDDGTEKELEGKDYTIEGTLTAGKVNTLTVKYSGKSATISVTGVVSVTVADIKVDVSQSEVLYSSATEDDIKGCLIVRATYNNGDFGVLTSDLYEVVIPQGFSSANNKVTVKCGNKSAEAELQITDVESTGIDVEFTDSGTITVNSKLEDLLSGIKITLNYNDGTTKQITPTADMLSGDIDSTGNKTITVTYIDPDDSTITHTDTFTVSVGKGTLDMSGVTFEDKSDAVYNGSEFSIELGGLDNLPDGVTYVYVYDGREQTQPFKFADAGTYEITVKFTGSDDYTPISDKKATLTISAADFDTSTLNFVGTNVNYDGEEHSISIDNAPEWLTVEYEGNNVSEIGSHTITVKFTHTNSNYNDIPSITTTLKIEKGKIAKPVFKGDIRYSGESILPKTSDFNGYDEDVMEIVAGKSEIGLYVGKYKIVFAILDTEHYEWDKSNTPSVAKVSNGKAVLVLTDEITLEEGEIAVEWSIGKAKLNATKKDGALPIFTSPSYKGAMDEVITYKYYTNKECTEEVAKEDIAAGQIYYVMASLEDSENFELDTTAIRFVGSSFSYNLSSETDNGNKAVEFLKKNWLWLVIALVALLIIIIIIVILARKKKDGNNGNGNNNPPYPPYNGGGQPPYPPYEQQPPYIGQPPYYDTTRAAVMPVTTGMAQPQSQPVTNGIMQSQIDIQQSVPNTVQIHGVVQPSQVQYVDGKSISALNAPKIAEHTESGGVGALVEEVHRLRSDVENIKSKSKEENKKLRAEVENARTMSAVESAKIQAISEIERVKNEVKFAIHSGSIS